MELEIKYHSGYLAFCIKLVLSDKFKKCKSLSINLHLNSKGAADCQ